MRLESSDAVRESLEAMRQRMAKAATVGEKAKVVAEALVRELETDVAIVRRRRGAWLNLMTATGISPAELPPSVAANEGMAARLIREGKTVVVEDVSTADVTKNLHTAARDGNERRKLMFRSCATTPLKVGDRVVGVMGVYCVWDTRRFSPHDLALLEGAAELLAVELAADDKKNESSGSVSRLPHRDPA